MLQYESHVLYILSDMLQISHLIQAVAGFVESNRDDLGETMQQLLQKHVFSPGNEDSIERISKWFCPDSWGIRRREDKAQSGFQDSIAIVYINKVSVKLLESVF